MNNAEVIATIRATHLKANISHFENEPGAVIHWDRARVDPGGTVFGCGPYLHVPVTSPSWHNEELVHRVYAPERLRKRLARDWVPDPKEPR